MNGRYYVFGLVLAMFALAALCGCSKVTKGNYEKIETGMSVAEVEKILGKGTEKAGAAAALGEITGAGKIMTWEDGEKNITVTFVNNKVTTKAQQGL